MIISQIRWWSYRVYLFKRLSAMDFLALYNITVPFRLYLSWLVGFPSNNWNKYSWSIKNSNSFSRTDYFEKSKTSKWNSPLLFCQFKWFLRFRKDPMPILDHTIPAWVENSIKIKNKLIKNNLRICWRTICLELETLWNGNEHIPLKHSMDW